jgi:parvulin-like peptidyl-prolyl isomerase
VKKISLLAAIFVATIAAGVLCGEFFCRTEPGRGMCAIVGERTGLLDPSAVREFVRQETLQKLSRGEPVAKEEIDRNMDLLRYQFADENTFAQARNSSGLTLESLRAEVTEHLRARHWIERQIAPELQVDASVVRRFYDENQPRFALPPRYRVSHIFLAAPDGYPDEVIGAKQSEIQGLSVRILAGEKFDDLVSNSEDEATKTNGGDLGYFSAWRMPPEFMAELEKMQVGEISAPLRSHLGFHLVRVTELKAAREMSLAEAQNEIALLLANEKRTVELARLIERLDAP